jgi:hypothetical protein
MNLQPINLPFLIAYDPHADTLLGNQAYLQGMQTLSSFSGAAAPINLMLTGNTEEKQSDV